MPVIIIHKLIIGIIQLWMNLNARNYHPKVTIRIIQLWMSLNARNYHPKSDYRNHPIMDEFKSLQSLYRERCDKIIPKTIETSKIGCYFMGHFHHKMDEFNLFTDNIITKWMNFYGPFSSIIGIGLYLPYRDIRRFCKHEICMYFA